MCKLTCIVFQHSDVFLAVAMTLYLTSSVFSTSLCCLPTVVHCFIWCYSSSACKIARGIPQL